MAKIDKHLADFLYELGMMKKISHCGTKFAGVKHPDSLAEHTCRAAQLGFILANLEAADAGKVSAMCLLHDVAEIRIGDAHRIAKRYLKTEEAERRSFEEQTENLPAEVKTKMRNLWKEFDEQKTLESQIARDSDLLETMIQAKEYLDIGHKAAKRWLDNGSKFLKTKNAKILFKEISKRQFTDWWDLLNKV
ncbi:MAG: HD domain-containing protein [Candidatus Gracilibacteria bacterium]